MARRPLLVGCPAPTLAPRRRGVKREPAAYHRGVALLLILLALFGFAFLGTGTSTSSTTAVPPVKVVKCSKQMSAGQQKQRRCYPPANP